MAIRCLLVGLSFPALQALAMMKKSMFFGYWLFVIRYWLLVIRYWLFVIGYQGGTKCFSRISLHCHPIGDIS
jgi:hypothetical protein